MKTNILVFLILIVFSPLVGCAATEQCNQEANKVIEDLSLGNQSESLIEHAIEVCLKPAENGDAEAQYHLGGLYSFSQKTQDKQQGYQWSIKSANNGYPIAQFNLGKMYESGIFVEKDLKKSQEWYKKAAENGLIIAQQKLGYILIKGIGQQTDFAKGIKWYEKAAQNGSKSSLKFLIKVYSKGAPNFPPNKERELYWKKKLIELDN